MLNLRRGIPGALLAAALLGTAVGAGSAGAPSAQVISYGELGKFIRGLKGKVVVVDFWADY